MASIEALKFKFMSATTKEKYVIIAGWVVSGTIVTNDCETAEIVTNDNLCTMCRLHRTFLISHRSASWSTPQCHVSFLLSYLAANNYTCRGISTKLVLLKGIGTLHIPQIHRFTTYTNLLFTRYVVLRSTCFCRSKLNYFLFSLKKYVYTEAMALENTSSLSANKIYIFCPLYNE